MFYSLCIVTFSLHFFPDALFQLFSFFFTVLSMSLQGGAAGLRQQVSGSEENHSAAAD